MRMNTLGVTHLDIKGRNFLMNTDNFDIVVTDFGHSLSQNFTYKCSKINKISINENIDITLNILHFIKII